MVHGSIDILVEAGIHSTSALRCLTHLIDRQGSICDKTISILTLINPFQNADKSISWSFIVDR
jgi:hypothetical protein